MVSYVYGSTPWALAHTNLLLLPYLWHFRPWSCGTHFLCSILPGMITPCRQRHGLEGRQGKHLWSLRPSTHPAAEEGLRELCRLLKLVLVRGIIEFGIYTRNDQMYRGLLNSRWIRLWKKKHSSNFAKLPYINVIVPKKPMK